MARQAVSQTRVLYVIREIQHTTDRREQLQAGTRGGIAPSGPADTGPADPGGRGMGGKRPLPLPPPPSSQGLSVMLPPALIKEYSSDPFLSSSKLTLSQTRIRDAYVLVVARSNIQLYASGARLQKP